MAIATRVETLLLPTWTRDNLFDALKTAFINAGFSAHYDDYVSGTDRYLVYEYVNDAVATYGKTYHAYRVLSNLNNNQAVASSHNLTTKAWTDSTSGALAGAANSSQSLILNAFNLGSEGRLVCLSQTGYFQILGLLTPANRPSWWNLGAYPYGFFFENPSSLRGTSRSPFANATYTGFLGNSALGVTNRNTGKPDIFKTMHLLNGSNEGVACWTSGDIGFGAFSGQTRYAEIIDSEENTIWTIVNNVAGGLCLRTG
jgi:hypothetical protein